MSSRLRLSQRVGYSSLSLSLRPEVESHGGEPDAERDCGNRIGRREREAAGAGAGHQADWEHAGAVPVAPLRRRFDSARHAGDSAQRPGQVRPCSERLRRPVDRVHLQPRPEPQVSSLHQF